MSWNEESKKDKTPKKGEEQRGTRNTGFFTYTLFTPAFGENWRKGKEEKKNLTKKKRGLVRKRENQAKGVAFCLQGGSVIPMSEGKKSWADSGGCETGAMQAVGG